MDLASVLGVVATVIDRAFPDPAQRDAAKLKLLELQQSGEMAQLAADTELAKAQAAINQTEAACLSAAGDPLSAGSVGWAWPMPS
jgi:hypothetical protein